MTALFLLATLLPYICAARLLGGQPDRALVPKDRRRFEALILGTGGLSGILHVLLFTGRLSIPAVAAAGAAGVGLAWTRRRGGPLSVTGQAPDGGEGEPGRGRAVGWTDWLSTCAVAATCGVWFVWSAASREVVGTDAAHYHIPHAVNYALGASPWGPMPTPHGYPMGAGVLLAWFILPFGDAFIVDASMVLWYAVMVVALASLFYTLTGLPGWTWVPWLAMVLVGLPLVSECLLPSADLPYAASFLAASAQLTWMVSRGAFMARDWVVLGVTLGLLVGCKAPGVYSSAALVSGAGLAWFAARRRSGAASLPWPAALAVVSGAALLTGGIWLVRNTWLFGRPVDVYTDRFYLSVMQDVRTVYGGDWLEASRRAGIMIGRLLGPHFLACGAAIVWLVAESAAVLIRRRPDPVAAARLWFVCLMALVAGVHVAGLVGAPWTSLESTGGGSLRYLLPFWVLYAFLAFVGLFGRLLPWHRVAALRTTAWLLLAAGATWQAAARHGAGGLNPGTDVLASLVATAALIAAAAAAPRPDRGPSQQRARALILARAAAVVLAAAGTATWLGDRHAALLAAAEQEESDRLQAWLTTRQPSASAHQQAFLDVRADEVRRGRACRGRRFFVASRFDLPLDLQPARFTSQVFDSRGFEAVLPLMRQSPGEGVCDYAIVSRDEPAREAIRLSASRLRPIESAGRFLTYAIVRPSAGIGNGLE